MPPHLRPSVVLAREKLTEGREKLRTQHDRGSPGIQVCAHQTDLVDTVLLDLLDAAMSESGSDVSSLLALIPHGGYGRRDVAPFSDVDLMVLCEPRADQKIAPFVRQFTQSIMDSGLQLGCSVRTPAEAVSLSLKDATVFTSLVESRYLSGNADLFANFIHRFRRAATKQPSKLIRAIEESRRDERRQYGETVYLLEPNLKRFARRTTRSAVPPLGGIRKIRRGRTGKPRTAGSPSKRGSAKTPSGARVPAAASQ